MEHFLNRAIRYIFSSSAHPPDFQNFNLSNISEDVGQSTEMEPEIFCSLRGRSKECSEVMIRDGKISPNLKDSKENSILHLVVTRDDLHIVDLIVSSFPNLIKALNSNRETIFHVAAGAGHLDVVKFLVNLI